MLDYTDFFEFLRSVIPADSADQIIAKALDAASRLNHGDMDQWLKAIEGIHASCEDNAELDRSYIRAGTCNCHGAADESAQQVLREQLMKFHPWRKGPFELGGIKIETEWRCDMKWDRLKNRISPLDGRVVLDVGSGNGYYCLRMIGQGARAAIGIEPYLLSVMQFQVINKLAGCKYANVLPLKLEDLPGDLHCFDTVFSMGVLYHCKEPLDHLRKISGLLRPGGELVLETLTIDSGEITELVPADRYAKMRNVWSIPSPARIHQLLEKSGFEDIELINVTATTSTEQRRTAWMQYESLADFLDPHDSSLTIEGYPAPQRAILIAKRSE